MDIDLSPYDMSQAVFDSLSKTDMEISLVIHSKISL